MTTRILIPSGARGRTLATVSGITYTAPPAPDAPAVMDVPDAAASTLVSAGCYLVGPSGPVVPPFKAPFPVGLPQGTCSNIPLVIATDQMRALWFDGTYWRV
jgi:hypothetical protein